MVQYAVDMEPFLGFSGPQKRRDDLGLLVVLDVRLRVAERGRMRNTVRRRT
jgi:hypothetical protein